MFDSLTGEFGCNNNDSFLGKAYKGIEVLKLSFTEDGIESSFAFNQGDVPGFNEIGDGGTYSSFLFNKSGNRIGSSEAEFKLVQQINDGSFIADITDTFNFGGGNTLTIKGQLNVQDFEALQPAELRVTGGSGIYDNAIGKAVLQQQQIGVLDVINADIQVII
ncbi:hypothetical protein H6G76_20000 [Nostoc sp. FACHB-152]|uniref:allene oxide cyclase barrel-like domain-containing protein n=1 Tax=unclassified Nostoc TaxID=2593658 RepID=UPI0016841AB0|nr:MULTISPECIES: hypothetical protein [unclassified Nostoc]MBD2449402.1 hypothetical protein [Nostoc sp. FACHB-152]MBD2470683.1 hypothetical protein [Nostoc sp. FACHB-145]